MSTPTSFLARVTVFAVATTLLGCGASLTPSQATADASAPDAPTIVDAPPDVPVVVRPDVFVPLSPPRPLAPLSTATVTTRRPTLRWTPGPGSDATRVEVCRDRACTIVTHAVDVTTDSNHPLFDLPPGAYFWRLFALAGGRPHPTPGPTWEFFVGPRSAPVDASWGTALDLNGDGYADLAVASRSGGGASSPTGVVHVFAGSDRGLLTAVPLASLTDPMPPSRGSYFAGDVGVRDLNGDGYADVVATAYSASEGRHWLRLFDGASMGPARSPTDSVVLASVSTAHYQSGQLAFGDHDGDSRADLSVIGSTLNVYPSGPTRGAAPSVSIAAPEGEQFAMVVGSR